MIFLNVIFFPLLTYPDKSFSNTTIVYTTLKAKKKKIQTFLPIKFLRYIRHHKPDMNSVSYIFYIAITTTSH